MIQSGRIDFLYPSEQGSPQMRDGLSGDCGTRTASPGKSQSSPRSSALLREFDPNEAGTDAGSHPMRPAESGSSVRTGHLSHWAECVNRFAGTDTFRTITVLTLLLGAYAVALIRGGN